MTLPLLALLASAVAGSVGNIGYCRRTKQALHPAHNHAYFWSKTFSYLVEVGIDERLTKNLGFYRFAESKYELSLIHI